MLSGRSSVGLTSSCSIDRFGLFPLLSRSVNGSALRGTMSMLLLSNLVGFKSSSGSL